MKENEYTGDDRTAIMAMVVDAFMGLRDGSNSVAHYNRLRQAMNIGLVRAEAIGQAEVEVFRAAQQALLEADQTYDALRCFTFTMATLVDLARGVEGYHDLLTKSTPQQMEKAGEEVERRLALGHEAKLTVH